MARPGKRCWNFSSALGKVFGAERLVRIRSAQVSGASYKTIGEYGLAWLSSLDARASGSGGIEPHWHATWTLAGDGYRTRVCRTTAGCDRGI